MFGLTIIRTERLKDLERFETKFMKVNACHRWFSGWKDLDIIWEYILEDMNFGGIDRARSDYAKARGTNEYGVPTPKPKEPCNHEPVIQDGKIWQRPSCKHCGVELVATWKPKDEK